MYKGKYKGSLYKDRYIKVVQETTDGEVSLKKLILFKSQNIGLSW